MSTLKELAQKYSELMSIQTEQNAILMEFANRIRNMEKAINVSKRKKEKE